MVHMLQWGRNLFVAECCLRPYPISDSPVLQWGRNLFVAECQAVVDPSHLCQASMGPQLVRCGMQSQINQWEQVLERFNGAATCSLRNERLCRLLDRGFTSFNGAATCSLRNGMTGGGVPAWSGASMGPQLVRCGMNGLLQELCDNIKASMGPQLVRCGMLSSGSSLMSSVVLQWGRNLFVAEWRDGRRGLDLRL